MRLNRGPVPRTSSAASAAVGSRRGLDAGLSGMDSPSVAADRGPVSEKSDGDRGDMSPQVSGDPVDGPRGPRDASTSRTAWSRAGSIAT